MSYQKPPIIDEDETAVPLGTTILPSMTTTTGHRSKRMLAILAAGMLMLVAGGAFLMQDASVSYDHAVGSLNTAAEDSGTTTTVTVVNDTPYDVRPLSRQNPSLQYTHVGYLLDFRYQNSLGMRNVCWSDHFDDPGIKAGQRWMASSSRGTCLVNKVVAVLSLPDGRGDLQCTNYEYEQDDFKTGVNTGTEETTGGTAKSIFYIRMGGGDGCCVRGSWQSPRCAPKQTYVHNPDYNYKT